MITINDIKKAFGFKSQEIVKESNYRKLLINSFPSFLITDINCVLDIIPLKDSVYIDFYNKRYKIDNLITRGSTTIKLKDEYIALPGRLYFTEPNLEQENSLTKTQINILNCIYTRHFDGHIRERRLNNLLNNDEFWIIPFKVHLLGEFVMEILIELDKHITEKNITEYKKFVLDNPKFWIQTKSRMVSWWNADYRYPKFTNIKDYIGYKIIKRINNTRLQKIKPHG